MSEDKNYHLNEYKKQNSHKKPLEIKKFSNDDLDEEIDEQNFDGENIEYEIEKMHIQLEKLRQTKRDLEDENENLDFKINNLKQIIKRIQEENDGI